MSNLYHNRGRLRLAASYDLYYSVDEKLFASFNNGAELRAREGNGKFCVLLSCFGAWDKGRSNILAMRRPSLV